MMLADLNPAMTMMGAQHGYGASAQHTVSGQQQCTVGLRADIVLTSVHCGVSRVVWAQEHDIGASRPHTIITALLPYYHYLFVDSGRQIILKSQ